MIEDSTKKAIELAIGTIEKRFGKGAIIGLEDQVDGIDFISSGSISLDIALGGGYPRGRIIEIYGPESSGKTTLALHAIAEIHKLGGVAAFIDAEHAFDKIYAQNLGVNISKDHLLFAQPDNGEQALEITEILVRSNKVDLIVIDSVAALTPKAEIEGEMGDSKMGLQARLMSQALRKITAVVSKSHTTIIFINQLRDKIGVMFGNPETTTGGNALKFYASQRLDIRRTSQNKEGEVIVSNVSKVKVVKNKVASPYRTAVFNITFGIGIDKIAELISIAVEFEIIKKSGSWYSYGETKLGQGIEAVKSVLVDNPELLEEIEVVLKSKMK